MSRKIDRFADIFKTIKNLGKSLGTRGKNIMIILEGKGRLRSKGGRTFIMLFLPKLSEEVECSESGESLAN